MFCYEIPQFEKKRILRTEMLEQLRDFPRDYLEILYSDYSDGILLGCAPGWNQGKLTVEPGILRYKGYLYFLKEPFVMECGAEDKIRYLKVRFHTPVRENGMMVGKSTIDLDDKAPNPDFEMELCRFRLQAGARLRDTYENFTDCITEFDTVQLVGVPWASPGRHTLHPKIMKQYAAEMLRKGNRDTVDTSFAMDILVNGGRIPEEAVRAYIEMRTGGNPGTGNSGLYYGLAEILRTSGVDISARKTSGGTRQQVMLL